MPKVIHIIPYDGIGGVESAARSLGDVSVQPFEVVIDCIFNNVTSLENRLATYNVLSFILAAWRASRPDVDVVVVSLWRSSIVGLMAKLIRPKLKLVTFLHCSKDKHFFDFFLTRLSIIFSTEVWSDSKSTCTCRSLIARRKKVRTISFVTMRFEAVTDIIPKPLFIFWGRITEEKDIDRAIRLFSAIFNKYPSAHFEIIGPDGGVKSLLLGLCASLGLKDVVHFRGAATHSEIVEIAKYASFYLQTSLYEGMAMSVVEAMQLGLVPIVTPVGEIGSYCKDGNNAVIVSSDEQAVADTLSLLRSTSQYQTLRANAIETWSGSALYRESFLDACMALLENVIEDQKFIQ